MLKSSTYASHCSAGSNLNSFTQSILHGSKSFRTSSSSVTLYFCFCAWEYATDIIVLHWCVYSIRYLPLIVKYLGGIYRVSVCFSEYLWNFVTLMWEIWGLTNIQCCVIIIRPRSQGFWAFIRASLSGLLSIYKGIKVSYIHQSIIHLTTSQIHITNTYPNQHKHAIMINNTFLNDFNSY